MKSSAMVICMAICSLSTWAQGSEIQKGPDKSIVLERPGDPPAPASAIEKLNEDKATIRIIRNGYLSVQVNVNDNGLNTRGDAANEPSIAVDPGDPSIINIGWRQFDTITNNFRQAGLGLSADGGQTWSFPGVLDPGIFRSDPVLDFDIDGNFYYNSLTYDSDYRCDVFKSTDGGANWSAPVFAYGSDKQWMSIDRTDGQGQGHIYQHWSPFTPTTFNRSVDGAASFEAPVALPEEPYWGTTTVAPDGTVFVAGLASWSSGIAVARSSNAQNALATPTFDQVVVVDLGGFPQAFVDPSPNPSGLLGQVWIASDHSGGAGHGNLYLLGSVNPAGSDPLDVHFSRSTDGGATWSDPVRVNDDPAGTNAWQWFGTMSVAPDGRIDVVWNDTRDYPGDSFTSELTYAYSTDFGVTWSTNEVLSPTFNPHLGWPQQNKIGDYYDMVSDETGAHLAYSATFNSEQDVYYLHIDPPGVFSDGLESGDTSAWSVVTP